jgi:hypothetical protein
MGYQLASPFWAYPYVQYQDDDDIKAFFIATNQNNQTYLDFFAQYNLALYTDSSISGALLDWTATGIYGLTRPIFPTGSVQTAGTLNTFALDTLTMNTFMQSGTDQFYVVNDDVFKRCMTWNLYKGDGAQFNIRWLKRRVLRFLLGANGADPGIDETYDIGVTFGAGNAVNINIEPALSALPIATILQVAVNSQVLQLPFQFSFAVNLL